MEVVPNCLVTSYNTHSELSGKFYKGSSREDPLNSLGGHVSLVDNVDTQHLVAQEQLFQVNLYSNRQSHCTPTFVGGEREGRGGGGFHMVIKRELT